MSNKIPDDITDLFPILPDDPAITWLSVYFLSVGISGIPLKTISQPVPQLLII